MNVAVTYRLKEGRMELAAARRPRTSAGIFTASMDDVEFLLLVFFMLTYTVLDALKRGKETEAYLLSEQETVDGT
jgi:hypothetical protein